MDAETKQQFEKIDQQFEKIDQRFDKLFGFLSENMLTRADLQEFATKAELREETSKILVAVDNIAKQTKDTGEEVVVLHQRIDTITPWIKKAAAKIGIEFNP